MYRGLLVAHGAFRWIVILVGAVAVASALWSALRGQPYESRHVLLGRAFAIAVDVQAVLGTVMYAVFSPLTAIPMALGITAPPGSEMYFFTSTHVQFMAAVLICVHVSAIIIRRGSTDSSRLRRTATCYALTLALLLSGVPWFRPLLRL